MKYLFLVMGLLVLAGCQPQPNVMVNPQQQPPVVIQQPQPSIIVAPSRPIVVRPGINIEISGPHHPHHRR